ncbi:endopeptidase La [Buchnera aphidicola (Thelaxes californica)]|uniref:Lon protease n=1 Tax=Buchnera aphidicola (Thelaxes californica) TaxID=1315998 RepID=A0A4D6YAL7_9GAMM|nr:endopeptidase La [Buchnera aphidicola]QCI26887.1 endopeptidase La [Buchnera aphidicola (Thelaxes californica)]
MKHKSEKQNTITLPMLPLRDVVIYPHMVLPLFIGRKKSIQCIEKAMKHDKKVMLITQKEASNENPTPDDLFSIGTISSIIQILQLPDGTIKVLVEGIQRANILSLDNNKEYFIATIELINSTESPNEKENDVLVRIASDKFKEYITINKKIPFETLDIIKNIQNTSHLSDVIAAHIPMKTLDKQSILEITNGNIRLEHLMSLIESDIHLLEIEKKIRSRVKKQMEKSQKEYYLNEQMKALQREMGEIEEPYDDHDILKDKINTIRMPKEAKIKAESELYKLKMMSCISAEASVIRGYIEWLLLMPWNKRSKIKKNLQQAQENLDSDHFGLEKIKERIIEYLAVHNRIKTVKGPILCLVGPPGVGKTSLGKSIANATGRKYVRIALGGIRDEAEIRGHRRTYIGSMPGKIIQNLAKIKVKNPLFLLDEIDKLPCDGRIDSASALLEVLDPEQNTTFNDHYLEIDFNLSEIMFIATANSMNIPAPLLDRMEIIKISGYTEEEKINIAQKYLIKKQINRNALEKNEIEIKKHAIIDIIRYYTRESGVRHLDRSIAKICRKVLKKIIIHTKIKNIIIDKNNLKEYLGIPQFDYGKTDHTNHIGQVIGLAWTEVGGDLLNIETTFIPGKGKLILTGSLGKVMEESIQTALTVVKSNSKKLGIQPNFHEKLDIHVHVPEGATPKDGPSAGIAMCTALVSSLTNIPVRSNIAMTGEITLRGNVLIIGGLKEKLLAAHRGGIKTVLIPYENKRDLEEIPNNIIKKLDIKPVKKISEVLKIALEQAPYKK